MNRILYQFVVSLLSLLLLPSITYGHNLSLGTVIVKAETGESHQFTTVFQMTGDQGKHLAARFSVAGGCTGKRLLVDEESITRLRLRQAFTCETSGLGGKTLYFQKLPPQSSLLVRAVQDDIVIDEQLLTGEALTQWTINSKQEGSAASRLIQYIGLGVEHILIGWDHLLFVFVLLLMIPHGWQLVKTITAFTIGHSITLALSTLGMLKVAIPPTEALIALSIVFLAAEIIRRERGAAITLTLAYPGIITALFGLFHGLGFASVLDEIQIPEEYRLMSLVGFNIGVEIGQLIFVAVILLLTRMFKGLARYYVVMEKLPSKQLFAYLGGSFGAFWLVERIAGF